MLNIAYSVSVKMDGDLSLSVLGKKAMQFGISIQNVAYPELKYLRIWKLAFSHVNTFLYDSITIHKILSGNFKRFSKMFNLRTTDFISSLYKIITIPYTEFCDR